MPFSNNGFEPNDEIVSDLLKLLGFGLTSRSVLLSPIGGLIVRTRFSLVFETDN